MTDEELDALEVLEQRTSLGPWDRNDNGDIYSNEVGKPSIIFDKKYFIGFVDSSHCINRETNANADFVVAAKEMIPKLIAEIRRLKKDK